MPAVCLDGSAIRQIQLHIHAAASSLCQLHDYCPLLPLLPISRSSRSVSKGAQYILHQAQLHDTLQAALADCDLSVAFTRWLPELQHKALPDIPSLLAHSLVQRVMQQPQAAASNSSEAQTSSSGEQPGSQQQQQQQWVQGPPGNSRSYPDGHHHHQRPVRIALVFGREEFGLSDAEVAACDLACAISIGRLQVRPDQLPCMLQWGSSSAGS